MIGLSAGTIRVGNWSTTPGAFSPLPFELISVISDVIARPVGETSPVLLTENDRIFYRSVASGTFYDQQMQIFFVGAPPAESTVSWVSSNPSVASINSSGFLTHHTNGTTIVTATLAGQSVSITLNLIVSGSANVDLLNDYVAGSLAKSISDAVDTRLVGKSASTSKALFTTQSHGTSAYVRNTNAWCSDLAPALTCISPWNSAGGTDLAGTSISRRHIFFATHYQIPPGATVRFITADNAVVDRVMVSSLSLPEPHGQYHPDFTIGLLDEALPETITPCKVLPLDWPTYLPSVNRTVPIVGPISTLPVLSLDREEKGLVYDLRAFMDDSVLVGFSKVAASLIVPNYSPTTGRDAQVVKRTEFCEGVTLGDSGNPSFLIVNNQLVLLTVFTHHGGGEFISAHIDEVNNAMSQLGGLNSGQLSTIDLSAFPNY